MMRLLCLAIQLRVAVTSETVRFRWLSRWRLVAVFVFYFFLAQYCFATSLSPVSFLSFRAKESNPLVGVFTKSQSSVLTKELLRHIARLHVYVVTKKKTQKKVPLLIRRRKTRGDAVGTKCSFRSNYIELFNCRHSFTTSAIHIRRANIVPGKTR